MRAIWQATQVLDSGVVLGVLAGTGAAALEGGHPSPQSKGGVPSAQPACDHVYLAWARQAAWRAATLELLLLGMWPLVNMLGCCMR